MENYHPRYQSIFSMYIRGLIPRNFAKFAEAVPIDLINVSVICKTLNIRGIKI